MRIRCSIFPFNAKKDSPFVPFSRRLGKISELSAPIRTIFASLLELSTFRRSLLPSNRLRHNLKSTLATAPVWQMRLTKRVHSQKCPLKYNPFPQTVHPSRKLTVKEDLLCVGGENREADPNFREKTGLWFRSFETALPSHGFVYKKLRQTPQPPPPLQKNPWNRLNGQQKPGKV